MLKNYYGEISFLTVKLHKLHIMDARRPVNLSRSRSAVLYCTCIAGIPACVANVIFLNFLPAATRELHPVPTLPCGLVAFSPFYFPGPRQNCPIPIIFSVLLFLCQIPLLVLISIGPILNIGGFRSPLFQKIIRPASLSKPCYLRHA